MRKISVMLVLVLVGLFAASCVSPTGPKFPTPDETGPEDPPPGQGFSAIRG